MADREKRAKDDRTIDPSTFEVLSAVNAVQFFYVFVRGVCGSLFYLIDRSAALLAGATSWIVVSCIWFFFLLMKTLLWRVVGTFVFVFYRIPKFVLSTLYRIILFIVHSFSNVFEDCTTAVVTLPSTILDVAHTTRSSFTFPVGWIRRMSAFVGIALLFTLPIPAFHSFQFLHDVRADTESVSIDGLALLEQGKEALALSDFGMAAEFFGKAEEKFNTAEQTLFTVPGGVRSAVSFLPIAGQKVDDGQRLIQIGRDAARAGSIVTGIAARAAEKNTDPSHFFTVLVDSRESIDKAFHYLADADTHASRIHTVNIPEQYRERFTTLREQLHSVVSTANQFLPSSDVIVRMMGSGVKRRYLVVFQNNTELRPTGGFIGSYALVDVLNGQLVNVEIPAGGSYDLQGSLSQHIQSPFPLHIVNPSWQFQDSNWFPDFPTSAKKMIWFYEKSGGPTVDGVIALNASFFQRMLGIIGSVDMSSYGKELTADNFFLETQKSVELEYDKKLNRPKQFIADLLPKTLEKIGTLDASKRSEFIFALITAAGMRDIQIFMREEKEEDILKNYGVTGEMRASPLDYFSLVQANVGGGKGEGVIDEDVQRRTVFMADGTIEAHVTIHRDHRGKVGDPFGGTRNISYIRMYFPVGTRSISANGFSMPDQALFKPPLEGYTVDETLRSVEGVPTLDPASGMIATSEYGKAVFAQWMTVEPQQESTAEAVFVLPFTVSDIPKDRDGNRLYSLLIQRQSGATTKIFTSRFESEGSVRLVGSSPENGSLENNTLTHILDPFDHDEVIGITLNH